MKQGDANWKDGRRGKLTASRFGDVLAKPTTKRFNRYIEDVVDELLGLPMFDDDDPPWFRHGKELEPEARGLYEFERTVDVFVPPELIIYPELPFVGCSPDGLVGDVGGIEIKSRAKLSIWVAKSRLGLESVYRPQVQGCMMVTQREWWDFINFYRPLRTVDTDRRISITRIYRDEDYIKKLHNKCESFWELVQIELQKRKQA